jgi:UDP-2,3-diacylglucosamine pyrophosphatase LpxH
MKTWAVLNDLQIPFHDVKVVDLVLAFIDDLKPHGVVLNGDVVDCYELSTYVRDPLTRAGLDIEIRGAGRLMDRLARSTSERVWIGGNHEDRLRRYLWRNAQALRLDADTEFERLFRLGEYGFTWKPYGDLIRLGKLTVTHGSLVRTHSAYTAKVHYEKYGTSVLIGHTHRLGIYYRTNATGVYAAYENGCLCRLDPEYVIYPDWQQGFSVVHVEENGYFHVQQIPILRRRTFFYGPQRRGVS